jgi:hypothetical protein
LPSREDRRRHHLLLLRLQPLERRPPDAEPQLPYPAAPQPLFLAVQPLPCPAAQYQAAQPLPCFAAPQLPCAAARLLPCLAAPLTLPRYRRRHRRGPLRRCQ